MPYCSRCGVEVEYTVDKCPLCRAPIQKFLDDDELKSSYPKDVPHAHPRASMTFKDKLRLTGSITTFGFLIPFFLVLSVDFFQNRQLTWSPFALSSLLLTWFWAVMPLFFLKKPYLIILLVFLSGGGFLFFLNLLTSLQNWFLLLGLPVLGFICGASALIILLIRKSKRRGINIAALILAGICGCCVIIDLLVNLYLGRPGGLRWSLIVVGAGLPVSGLLFYLHRVAGRKSRLKSFFHL